MIEDIERNASIALSDLLEQAAETERDLAATCDRAERLAARCRQALENAARNRRTIERRYNALQSSRFST